jgi:hypothetical protein
MNKLESQIYQIKFLETYHEVMKEVTFCIFTAEVTGIIKLLTQK